MVLDRGQWHAYRLPKASHTYDGAHGWNTEWPRIRDIGEDALLMTMHGSFWRFPRTFSAANSAGLAPRSTHLKVIGDFCRRGDRVVLGCDDTAKSEFLNKHRKRLTLSQASREPVTFRLEADFTGTGAWAEVRPLTVPPGEVLNHAFPDGFGAYWLRLFSKPSLWSTARFVLKIRHCRCFVRRCRSFARRARGQPLSCHPVNSR